MKKILTIFILGLIAINAQADMKALQERLKLQSSLANNKDGNVMMQEGVSTLSQHVNWPGSNDKQQALIIISWDGFTGDELNGMVYSATSTSQSEGPTIQRKNEGTLESWVFVPLGTNSITLTHPKYGNTRVNLPKLNHHDVYSVPVVVDNLLNIEVRPMADYDKSVRVTLVNPETGDEMVKMSPAVFERVMPGSYDVLFNIDGRNESKKIIVTPTQRIFAGADFDFRHSKPVTFESTEKSYFFIDGAFQQQGTTYTVDLPYGTHTITAKVSDNQKDEKTIDVSEDSESVVYLSPIPSKTFEVVGMYQGKPVETYISVSGLSQDRYSRGPSTKHVFTLPVGSVPHTYNLSYAGHSGSKEISVTSGMNNVQEIKIKADQKMIWPWQRDYEPCVHWWEFSYVTKQYATSINYDESSMKFTFKENGVWDDGYNKWLHGFRMGYHAQPAFKFGLGFYTGLFTEFYFSATKDAPIGPYDKYFEWDLSVPLHIMYQMPLGEKFCIGFHTGPSFNIAVLGSYYDKVMPNENDYDNEKDWMDFWGEPGFPSRFNMDWDFTLFIRWKKLMISGTLSRGMTNNGDLSEFYDYNARTVMNKAVVALSLGF